MPEKPKQPPAGMTRRLAEHVRQENQRAEKARRDAADKKAKKRK